MRVTISNNLKAADVQPFLIMVQLLFFKSICFNDENLWFKLECWTRHFMRHLLLFVFYIWTTTAFGQKFNDSIPKIQEKALKISPFSDAKTFKIPKAQKDFRLTKFPKIISDILLGKTQLVDTLWMVESNGTICAILV